MKGSVNVYRIMRRSDRALSKEEAKALLQEGTYGVLSTVGPDGIPYGVPVSYAYVPEEETLYFHGAPGVGQKRENIQHCSKACFTVVGQTEVLPQKFSTRYESAVAYGDVTICTDPSDKLAGLEHLVEKYSAPFAEEGADYARRSVERTEVYAFRIRYLSGKARR